MVQDNFTHEPQPNRSEKSPGRIVVRDKKKPIFSANEFESWPDTHGYFSIYLP